MNLQESAHRESDYDCDRERDQDLNAGLVAGSAKSYSLIGAGALVSPGQCQGNQAER